MPKWSLAQVCPAAWASGTDQSEDTDLRGSVFGISLLDVYGWVYALSTYVLCLWFFIISASSCQDRFKFLTPEPILENLILCNILFREIS